jgi:MFS family permease
MRPNADFSRLWLGQSAAMFGNMTTQVALPLLSIAVLNVEPSTLGLISTAQTLPLLLSGPILGHYIDAVRRRPLLIGSNVCRCLISGLVLMLISTHLLAVWNLALCAFAMGTLTSINNSAWFAYLPTVVAQHDLVSANARMQASYSVAQVGGGGLGGFLLKVTGPQSVFLFNVVTFLFAALSFTRIRYPEQRPQRKQQDQSNWLKLSSGFRVLLEDPILRLLLAEGAWFNLCEQAFMTVFLLFAVRSLGMGTDMVGYCIGLGAVGAVAGSFTASTTGRRVGKAKVLVFSMGLASVGQLLVTLARDSHLLLSAALITLSFCCYGFGLAVYNTHSISERQMRVDPSSLGRANTAFQTIVLGTIPLGSAAGGVLAELFGNRPTLIIVGVLLVAAWVPFSMAIIKSLNQLVPSPRE